MAGVRLLTHETPAEWADATIWRAVLGADVAPTEDRVLEISGARGFEERSGRKMASVRLQNTVAQVAWPSAHHRGQVAPRLRELNVEPSMTDYIGWLWFDRPPTEWP